MREREKTRQKEKESDSEKNAKAFIYSSLESEWLFSGWGWGKGSGRFENMTNESGNVLIVCSRCRTAALSHVHMYTDTEVRRNEYVWKIQRRGRRKERKKEERYIAGKSAVHDHAAEYKSNKEKIEDVTSTSNLRVTFFTHSLQMPEFRIRLLVEELTDIVKCLRRCGFSRICFFSGV